MATSLSQYTRPYCSSVSRTWPILSLCTSIHSPGLLTCTFRYGVCISLFFIAKWWCKVYLDLSVVRLLLRFVEFLFDFCLWISFCNSPLATAGLQLTWKKELEIWTITSRKAFTLTCVAHCLRKTSCCFQLLLLSASWREGKLVYFFTSKTNLK